MFSKHVLNFSESKCSSIDSSFLSTFKNVERLVMKKASLGIGLIGSDKQGAFLTTNFPEKLMLFRLLNSTNNVMTSHP
jgi:hypothetical protein